jgi:hypothetical protein
MNPENQGGYPDPNQPQTPAGYPDAPGPRQTPQVYGPQQYSPMAAFDPTKPMPKPPKNNKKLVIGAIALAALLLVIIVLAIVLNLPEREKTSPSQGISRSYDSPVGLLPGLQAGAIQSGKYKLTASYVTGNNFTRTGTFSVEDGHVYFDLVPDDTRVNELLSGLYGRSGATAPFKAEQYGVSRSQTFDFASMLGYHYLYDQHGSGLSGFVPQVEAAKATTTPDPRFTLTTACDAALKNVKERTAITTTGLTFETRQEGVNKRAATVSFSALQAIDKSVNEFFDKCFDLKQPALASLKQFADARRQNVTKSPSFIYWQENGVDYLDVSAPPGDTPFGGGLHFELSSLSPTAAKHSGGTGSYVERRNQFGLAYSLCRVDPVVTTTLAAGYQFLHEDAAYAYPGAADTGYYCSTLSVPGQYKPASVHTLQNATGKAVAISGAAIDGLRSLHDLTYQIEQYNINNERYPGPTEFRDMVGSNMGALTSTAQTAFAAGSLVYTPLPAGCVGTCNDYALSYVPAANVQVKRSTYKP